MRPRPVNRTVLVLLVSIVAVAAAPWTSASSAAPSVSLARDLEAAQLEAARSDRPLVVIFGAVWCPVCREMKERTLRSDEILNLAEEFEWVAVDIDRSPSLAREYEIEATPTLYVLAPDGTPVRKVVGGPTPERLRDILHEARAAILVGAPALDTSDDGFDRRDVTATPVGFRGDSVCFSHVGYGPLRIRSQSPFQSLRLGLGPRSPSTLARGQWEVRTGLTWVNVWASDEAAFDPANGELGRYLLDYESLHVALSAAYGVSDTFQIELGVADRSVFGGVMDGFIEGFHDLFGIDQAGRDRWPRDQLAIFLENAPGQPVALDAPDRGTYVRDLLVTVQQNVTCGTETWPAISWAVTGRYALQTDLQDGDAFDVGVSVALSRRFGNVYGYLTLGYSWYGDDTALDIPLDDTQATVLAAAEWRFHPRQSFILQWLWSQGAAIDLGPFSESANEVTLGWKWEAVPSGVLEIGLIENVITFDNSPDFGVHAAWTQRF